MGSIIKVKMYSYKTNYFYLPLKLIMKIIKLNYMKNAKYLV